MFMRLLVLGLASIWSLQACGEGVRAGSAEPPGSRLPKTVSSEPAVQAAAYVLHLPSTTRLEVFSVVYERLVPVTSETIEGNHDYKITVPGPFPSRLQLDMAHALEAYAIDRIPDEEGPFYCDWAAVFYDMKGNRVLTMYFGDSGDALINGTHVVGTAAVMQVLERRCSPLWQQ
jgi:hypothetical protein